VSPAADQPDILKKVGDLVPKIKTPVQLAGFVAFIIAAILARTSLLNAVGIAGLGMLFLAFGQVFAQLDKIPENSRASFLLWSLLFFILAFALNLAFAYYALRIQKPSAVTSVSSAPAIYPPAEQKIVDLKCEIESIRAAYTTLQDRPDRADAVNKSARQLAELALLVDDGQLSRGVQIYKYEAVAYLWAMVAGSEDDSAEKVETTKKILKATEKGNNLVEEAMRTGLLDTQKMRDTRDWIIKDDAVPRLQRLAAIALCVRWQVKKNPDDRLQVREIIRGLPNYYLKGEQPEKTTELRPCLVDSKANPQPLPR
jgi:hypothetical protein